MFAMVLLKRHIVNLYNIIVRVSQRPWCPQTLNNWPFTLFRSIEIIVEQKQLLLNKAMASKEGKKTMYLTLLD